MKPSFRTGIALVLATCVSAACVVYDPAYYANASYERSWSAAVGGAQDAGVTLTQVSPETGTLRGIKNGIDVTVLVDRLPDGGVQVKFDAKGDTSKDPQLSERFTQAYNRRMGR